jgi:hypothetical protein
MNEKFHIETYREHEIWYNADKDKFTVELLIDDDWRTKDRKSLKDCRKAIDLHIKTTAEFKPFKIIFRGRECTVKSVRADGGLLLSWGEGKDFVEISCVLEQLSGKEAFWAINEYNADYIEWLKEQERIEEENSKRLKAHDKIKPQLKLLDLSFIHKFKTT